MFFNKAGCFLFLDSLRERANKPSATMEFRNIFMLLFTLNIEIRAQDNFLQYMIEQTNFLLYNSSNIIEDTVRFLPWYDFIIIGSGSGGWSRKQIMLSYIFSMGHQGFRHRGL